MVHAKKQMPPTSSTQKVAVLLPGMGAVATTFIAGVGQIREGGNEPIGSLALTGTLPESSTREQRPLHQAMGLAGLDQLVFGGWDIYEDTAYDAAERAGVLNHKDMVAARPLLQSIRPMPAVFDQEYVKNLRGTHIKQGESKWHLAQQLVQDIKGFMSTHGCSRAVAVWCASTERWTEIGPVHQTIEAFEQGMKDSHPEISPSMLYTWAFMMTGVPFANGAPNLCCDVPALQALALRQGVPIAGKDFKTGQTLMKTILAPGFAARQLGVRGWYSTNILGNTDGAVLDDPGSFKTKEESKLSVLDSILDKEAHPGLYGDITHKVRIDYYPPRGDNKEGWDNIDIFGWMGYPMQIKINFLCRDSILAAPLVLDLALFMDLAGRMNKAGVQDWLSFYFKAPQPKPGQRAVHDLFAQQRMLFEALEQMEESTANVHALTAQ